VVIGTPGEVQSDAARALQATPRFSLERAERHVMGLTFDRGSRGASADLRPDLPLVLNW
jgi:hypothetical protein